MNTFTYDLRVEDCSRDQLASYARTLAAPAIVGVQPLERKGEGFVSYRLVVRPATDGADGATIVSALAWMLNATGRFVSVRHP